MEMKEKRRIYKAKKEKLECTNTHPSSPNLPKLEAPRGSRPSEPNLAQARLL